MSDDEISLRELINIRNNFRNFKWDERIGISKPEGFDELPIISEGFIYKRNKYDEIRYAARLAEDLVEKRKTLLIEQRLEEIDDIRLMGNDTYE
ncbi:hypothetical protein [Enterococcus faecalis]|uniref:hypothetical protein n=1 Tax=Enterococcus faecalis TaxID=1351 RepID=UPI001CF48A91|nr:hypothetical protein [Enterococcus faecalis]MCA6777739.1 hypothetical protein [Enterococcus faecalis]HCT6711171.1 hypothetical protein [Enterococcus faecalis]HCT6950298.1 hypothetical protein [Enterococcus faecalis]HCT6953170.1 hypothetical protein [Enterococcus faecalis]HCT6961320.1 hypothetical protein [Enterococcus faecalis]